MTTAQVEEYPVTKIKVADVIEDLTNPNKMSKEAMEGLKKSLLRFGDVVPITVNTKMLICDGWHRVEAFKQLGWTEISAYIVSKFDDDIERRLFRQTMNKLRGQHEITMDADEISLIFQNNKLEDLSQLLAQNQEDLMKMLSSEIVTDPIHDLINNSPDGIKYFSYVFNFEEKDKEYVDSHMSQIRTKYKAQTNADVFLKLCDLADKTIIPEIEIENS